jgi:hypothetical protein
MENHVNTLEEYITKRKSIDKVNEKDKTQKMYNLKMCLGYVVDYFESYIDVTPEEEKLISNQKRAENYAKTLGKLSQKNREWLTRLYLEHRNYVDRYLRNIINNENPEFFLLSSEED